MYSCTVCMWFSAYISCLASSCVIVSVEELIEKANNRLQG